MHNELKLGLFTLLVCVAVAILSTAITSTTFPHWSVYAHGAVSGIWAGLTAQLVVPKLRSILTS